MKQNPIFQYVFTKDCNRNDRQPQIAAMPCNRPFFFFVRTNKILN